VKLRRKKEEMRKSIRQGSLISYRVNNIDSSPQERFQKKNKSEQAILVVAQAAGLQCRMGQWLPARDARLPKGGNEAIKKPVL
jgi:hypothetical protein